MIRAQRRFVSFRILYCLYMRSKQFVILILIFLKFLSLLLIARMLCATATLELTFIPQIYSEVLKRREYYPFRGHFEITLYSLECLKHSTNFVPISS